MNHVLMTEVLKADVFAVHHAFAETEHGKTLAGKIRYEKYNLAQLPNEEWVRLLGADVNNLTHMPLTYGLANSFIRTTELAQPDYFSEGKQTLLQVAAVIHDQGEAIVGDISYGDKTEGDEAEEKSQFAANSEAFCPGASPEMKQLIVQARDEIVFNSTTKLGMIFNAIERVGYVRTALRAAAHLEVGAMGSSSRGLEWLIADVLSNQPLQLMAYAQQYEAVDKYLCSQGHKISAAFERVEPPIFELYGQNSAKKRDQFTANYRAWRGRYDQQ